MADRASQYDTTTSDFGLDKILSGRLKVRVSNANVSNPPTAAQATAALGSPASVGEGGLGVINDNGAGTNVYVLLSVGGSWYRLNATVLT